MHRMPITVHTATSFAYADLSAPVGHFDVADDAIAHANTLAYDARDGIVRAIAVDARTGRVLVDARTRP